ncbi:UNVERIFIED_CONTAM: hypothetical protein Sradi_5407600 [Sesamum radiatum]|uniref:Uncharacterized protein n=1 Tax=Sesamum radiatum TaxID=300843 RepID=A0AAW2LUJ1_SESRA
MMFVLRRRFQQWYSGGEPPSDGGDKAARPRTATKDFKLSDFSRYLMKIDGRGPVRLAMTRRVERWWSGNESRSVGGEFTSKVSDGL